MRIILTIAMISCALLPAQDLSTLALTESDSHSIHKLRAMGERGLSLLLDKYNSLYPTISLRERKKMLRVIDQVSGQKHAAFCKLYWYKNLELAKKAAAVAKKPILLLRLLGKLDEEFC